MNILNLFMHDHRRCDALFEDMAGALRAGELHLAADACVQYRAAMDAHLLTEEEEMFPAFERATGVVDGITAMMRDEHARMRAMMRHMADALAAGDAQGCEDQMLRLTELLEHHAIKEERLIYALCDERLGVQHQTVAAALARRAQP